MSEHFLNFWIKAFSQTSKKCAKKRTDSNKLVDAMSCKFIKLDYTQLLIRLRKCHAYKLITYVQALVLLTRCHQESR